jgi:hypothetical protein
MLSFIVLSNLKLSPKFQFRTIIPSGCSAFFGDQCIKGYHVGFVTKAVIPGRVVSRFHARHGGSIN